MHKRTSKKEEDVNTLAASIVGQATGGAIHEKNPFAVALGRLGGLKGGKARAKKLSSEQRIKIAKKAATARWSSKRNG